MSKFKNYLMSLMSLMIASLLLFSQPVKKAEAGIILVPVLIGIVLLVVGIENHDVLLIILGADGNISQDALEQSLDKKYAFIDDLNVIHQFALMIKEKAKSVIEVNGQKLVTFTAEEVKTLLEPTGLAFLHPELVEGMISDLR